MPKVIKKKAQKEVAKSKPILKAIEVAARTDAATIQDPVFINTKWGAVAVFGHEEISKKALLIVSYCLNLPAFTSDLGTGMLYHGVKSIVFRSDGYPRSLKRDDDGSKPMIYGNANLDTGSIAINLMRIMARAIELAKNDENLSITAGYHRNFIGTVLHEIHHLATQVEVPDDFETREALELEAEEWSLEMLNYLAQNHNIEPGHHAESPFFCKQLMELLKENNDDWSKSQRHMLENNIFYSMPETDDLKAMDFCLFKAFLHMMSDDDVEDKKWAKATIAGFGEESPLLATIRAVDTETKPVKLWPTTATPNTADHMSAASGEDMEMEDPGDVGMFIDPNAMGFGGFSGGRYQQAPQQFATPQPTPQQYAQPASNSAFPVGNLSVPENIMPQQAVATQMQPEKAVYAPTGLSMQQTADLVIGVYKKIYNHLFTYGQRLLNSETAFANKGVIRKGIPLTPEEMSVVVKMDCLDEQGRWCGKMVTSGGQLYGYWANKKELPTWKLYINMNGVEVCRWLLPQGTAQKAPGVYSKTALAARAGSCIMYVMEGNDAISAATGKKILMKFVDGVLTSES